MYDQSFVALLCGLLIASTGLEACPVEPGYCVRADGADQNDGVFKVDESNDGSEQNQQDCLWRCRNQVPGATGCELIWDRDNHGCYAHTQSIDRGNGDDQHKCWVFSKCQDSGDVTFVPPGDLDHLTADITNVLKTAALDAGWHTACQRYAWPIYESESNTFYGYFNDRMDEVFLLAAEIISPGTLENLRWMFLYMAWYTANYKVGYFNDADNDMVLVDQYRQWIIDSGDMTVNLVDNIKWMAHDAGWYQQHTRWMYWPGASDAEYHMNEKYDLIVGDFIVQEVKFNEDSGKIYSTSIIHYQTMDLPNYTDMVQHQKHEWEVTQGTTSSTTHNLAFGIAIGGHLDIRLFFLTLGLSAEFNVNAGGSWTESMRNGEVQSFSYDLYVPPHSHYKGQPVVTEGVVSMDYEIIFTVSGKYHSMKGVWYGTAVDSSTYTVCDVADADCNL